VNAEPFPWPVHPTAEIFALLPDDELTELANDIAERGLTHRVWLWDDPERGTVLLDGRNRIRACQEAGVEVETRLFVGDEVEAAEFAFSENMRRRHLTTGQKAAAVYDFLPVYEASNQARANRLRAEYSARQIAGQERDKEGRVQPLAGSSADLRSTRQEALEPTEAAERGVRTADRSRKASEQAAKKAGTSGRAAEQYKRVKNAAPDLAEQVRSGDIALDRAERVIRDRVAEQKRIEQARAEAEAQPEPIWTEVRHGDFREVLADVGDVDAIITDPPYPHEFIPLLGDLAEWADKVLTPDGVMAVLIGQTYLPEVYRLLDGHRPYRWTACYLTDGPGYVSHPRKVQSNWKPLIVYGGGPRFADVVRSEGSDANAKTLHKWGQDYNAFHTIIERLTTRGQTVADPFMGSGTTLLAARALGRHAIGCDTELEHVNTAKERVA
jgi:ParB-like chromosome segregation protein Spo0J